MPSPSQSGPTRRGPAPKRPRDPRPANDSGPPPGPRALRLRDSLAARISALVLLVLFATGTSAVVILGQLRALQASFDRLIEVYVAFNQRLAEAHVQAVRIGEQVRRHAEQERLAPEVGPEQDDVVIANLEEALDSRGRLIAQSRAPIDDALRHPERFGGEEQLAELRGLAASLDQLDDLVELDAMVDPVAVLSDQRTQSQIDQLLKSLAAQSSRAISDLQKEVSEAQRRTERVTLALTLVAVVLGVFATVGVFWMLRPLRRLSQGVRLLGRGDWSQRIELDRAQGRENEVSQLAQEFNLMAGALEERERLLIRSERLAAAGQLASQITHEIRNPLSSVALNAELLEDELDGATPEARQLLTRISREVDRLTAVTEDYLGFARRPKPELTPIDLRTEIDGLIEFLAEEHEQAGVELEVRAPDEPSWVMGDANQLRQAFMNLLRNAKEAVLDPEDGAAGETPRIAVTLECKPDAVEVVISDNGPGISLPPEKLDRIFEAFYTRKARGTGLGLPIVQQILHDHGGTIQVARTGPEGTTFLVRVPACDPPATSVSSQAATAR